MVAVDPVIVWVVRTAIAALLIGAAIPKLRERAEFAGTVANYRIVPTSLAGPLALALPVAELGLGLAALAFRPALAGAALLLAAYAGAVALNLARGRDHIDCGCHLFGQSGGAIDRAMVVRNLLLATAALIAALAPVATRTLGPVDLLSIAASVVLAGLVYACVEQARINHSRAAARALGGAMS